MKVTFQRKKKCLGIEYRNLWSLVFGALLGLNGLLCLPLTFLSPQDQNVQIAAMSDKSSATESLVTTQQAIVEDLKNKVQLLDSENAGDSHD